MRIPSNQKLITPMAFLTGPWKKKQQLIINIQRIT